MFYQTKETEYRALAEGIEMKSLVHGEKTHMCQFRLKHGAVLPRHSHAHEQTGCLISGRVNFHMGGTVLEARAGDCWCIPGHAEHWAECLEDAVIIEVFSPVREDYLP